MNNPEQPISETVNDKYSYFQIQSTWGVTKHFGGLKGTEELAGLCHVSSESYILEVGCGVGFTTCHLAQKFGCRIVGVDISEGMLAWARKRVERKGVADRVELRLADAQALPFEDGVFDAMLCESVTAFVPDKVRAINEYRRVVKSGGYLGLNEGTWVKGTPPEDFQAFIRQSMGSVHFLEPAEWQALLENAGLQDVRAQVRELGMMEQRMAENQGMDMQDWLHRLSAVGTMISMYVKDPEFRRYTRQLIPSRSVISDMFVFLGYGLYTGRV